MSHSAIVFGFCLGAATFLTPCSADQSVRLLVLSYNIHHGEGTDGKIDLERIASVITRSQADLIALQEVDRGTGRSGGVDQSAVLGELTRLQARFAKQIDFDGGAYGQAVLSRYPIQSLDVQILPGQPERARRIVGVATIIIGRRTLQFATTHLHHAREDLRIEQATRLNELWGRDGLPTLLAGDLNATPDSMPMQILSRRWLSATTGSGLPTFPASSPQRQIDFVLARPREAWQTVESSVLAEAVASDHGPLLSALEWQPAHP